MRKGKWANLFGGIFAAATIGTVAVASKHVSKKYGQKINDEKIISLELNKVLNAGLDKFLHTDDDVLLSKIDSFLKKEEESDGE
jgi:hypothetical protein